ncbi:protein kinase [Gemmatimonadota bacterium]
MKDQQVGHYKILEKLGAGGMGEVWLAEDTRLERKVALKFLRIGIEPDSESINRFNQEAIAASAIDHPNICTIHEIAETDDGRTFICMAYYEGQSLRELIDAGLLDIDSSLDIVLQIAKGLDKAHQAGIVHRDIKPENILVTVDGLVKILDFGLAKLTSRAQLTVTGATLGTASYMSPEQARGGSVDYRTDLWSLGVILFEMLTGQRPFEADDPQAVIFKILNDDPSQLKPHLDTLPQGMAAISKRALQKDPESRYQTAADFSREISEITRLDEPVPQPPAQRSYWLAAAISVIVIATVLVFSLTRGGVDVPVLSNVQHITFWDGLEDDPAWSPSGDQIAFTSREGGNWDIWLYDVVTRTSVNLTSDYRGFDGKPTWSPDGRWIAFLSEREGHGIYKISMDDGETHKIVGTPPFGTSRWTKGIPSLAWSPNGSWIASSGGERIFLIDPERGFINEVYRNLRQWAYTGISWSPDGLWLAVTEMTGTAQTTSSLWVFQVEGMVPTQITDGKDYDQHPVWSSEGSWLYFLSNRKGSSDIWRTALDSQKQPQGELEQISDGRGIGSFTFSPTGDKIAFGQLIERSNIWTLPFHAGRMISWAEAEEVTSANHVIETISVSTVRRQIAYDSNQRGNVELFICNLDGTDQQFLTDNPAGDWAPNWSPDGSEIVFHSSRSGDRDIFVMSIETGKVRTLVTHAARDWFPFWSPSGNDIAFFSRRSGNSDIWIVASDGSSPPEQITTHLESDGAPFWSPDGQYILFRSNRSGRTELYRIHRNTKEVKPLTNMQWDGMGQGVWSLDQSEIIISAVGGPDVTGCNLWAVAYPTGRARLLLDSQGSSKELMWSLVQIDNNLYLPLSEPTGDLFIAEFLHR